MLKVRPETLDRNAGVDIPQIISLSLSLSLAVSCAAAAAAAADEGVSGRRGGGGAAACGGACGSNPAGYTQGPTP